MATEVYSWRVPAELKQNLEREARRRNTSVSRALQEAAIEWIQQGGSDETGDEKQRRLHATLEECIASIPRGPRLPRADEASQAVAAIIRKKHGR